MVSVHGPDGSFQIFFLEDSSRTSAQALEVNIDQLRLANTAWLVQEDLEFYDFSTHCLYLRGDKGQFFDGFSGSPFLFDPVLIDKPFVVVANNVRCYVGALRSGALSATPRCPYMDELDVGYYPSDVMHISRAWTNDQDARNDCRIEDALVSLNLLRGGITVELQHVDVVENSDTSTVEYVFTITNNDQNVLLIPDPNRMGVELFHYYTNGVVLRGDNGLFQSLYKQVVVPPSPMDSAWYEKLPVSHSMQRTVRLRGYPELPKGNYMCDFTIGSPKVDKWDRYPSESRIWMGEAESSTLSIQIQ